MHMHINKPVLVVWTDQPNSSLKLTKLQPKKGSIDKINTKVQ